MFLNSSFFTTPIMTEKKLFTFKYEKSDTILTTPKTPVKRVPYKDIFEEKKETQKDDTPTLTKIATGDFFEVYRTPEGTAVRKTLGVVRNDVERRNVLREVEILKRMNSPFVLKYLRDWEVDRHIYIEVEYCNLGTLRDLMNLVYFTRKSSFSKSLVGKIMRELSLGLQEIHNHSIVHLDLKPENIFLQGEANTTISTSRSEDDISPFRLVIGDFNISRVEGEEMGMDGDKKYMAPEILDNIFCRASDVYSLGLIYLEILNGIILPSSGEGWLRLRQGVFTGIHLEGPAKRMLSPDYKMRIDTSSLVKYFNEI